MTTSTGSEQSRSLVDQVFRELADGILSGRHKPGSHLPSERALAEQLEVNRQVVREAIRRLAQLGLVQVLHGDGTRVLDFREHGGLDLLALLMEQAHGKKSSLALLVPILELRGALAPEVVRHCALRAKLATRREIITVTQEMARAKDEDALYALEARFWNLVHEGAGQLVYQLTYNTFKRCAASMLEQTKAWTAAELKRTRYRLPIAEAIAAGDAERAERETRTAMRGMLESWLASKQRGKAKPATKRARPRSKLSSA
jgi:GntR family transcriptional regulator, transcriptional repressor for pyruvate dehydrogenase complex